MKRFLGISVAGLMAAAALAGCSCSSLKSSDAVNANETKKVIENGTIESDAKPELSGDVFDETRTAEVSKAEENQEEPRSGESKEMDSAGSEERTIASPANDNEHEGELDTDF